MPSGGHASSPTWWPKLEPMQNALQFGTNASGATWWSNFELIQVEPHTIGQNWVPNFGTNASGILFSWRDYSS